MKIWLIDADLDKNFKTYQFEDAKSSHFSDFCNAVSTVTLMDGNYSDTECEVIKGEIEPDFAYLWAGGVLAVTNEQTKEFIEKLLGEAIELIPLKCQDKKLYALHILSAYDAVDHDKSVIKKLKSGLEVHYETYEFIPSKLQGAKIFYVYLNGHLMSTETFVTDEVKAAIEQKGLTGVKFTQVYGD